MSLKPECSVTRTLYIVQERLKRVKTELQKDPGFTDVTTHKNVNEGLKFISNNLIPQCLNQGTGLERKCISDHNELIRLKFELNQAKSSLNSVKHELIQAKSRLNSYEENENKRAIQITQQLHSRKDLVRKIHGHKDKDEADPNVSVTNYSQLLKSTFDPLYDTLEETPFNLNEDESSYVVNHMFQMIYTKCTELVISKMTKQLEKLFVQQGEVDDIEKERMTDTRYAYGLLLHAANIKEYKMNDDLDKIMAILHESSFIRSMFEKTDHQKLQLLIKQTMETIQSFLILVPPMVVDCCPYPDMESRAYPAKKAGGSTLERCVTTQSALFYSYQGELVARPGEYAPISNEFLAQFSHSSLQENAISEESFTNSEGTASKEKLPLNEFEVNQREMTLEMQNSEGISPHKKQIVVPPITVQDTEDVQKQRDDPAMEHKLEPLVVVVKTVASNGNQRESNEQHRQPLQEFYENNRQKLELSDGKHQKQLQEVVVEGFGRVEQQLQRSAQENTLQQLMAKTQYLCSQLEKPRWVVEVKEIKMTGEVVDREGWEVGEFRGTRVAVKHLHLSQENLTLFYKKMHIASFVHHPNLIQFMGATEVDNPMILTELLSTSLRKEMNRSEERLPQAQILSISQAVASALNYLHLWKPEPLYHCDVSSSNVLLEPSGHDQWKGKLSDYGSANLQQKMSPIVDRGDPAYAAHNINDHFRAMDVYSFGILLLEMVVHHPHPPDKYEKQNLIWDMRWPRMKSLITFCTRSDPPIMSTIVQHLHDMTKPQS